MSLALLLYHGATKSLIDVMNNLAIRQQVLELSDWSDEELKDIGLKREDVLEALQTPLLQNPSRDLPSVAEERRLNQRPRSGRGRNRPAAAVQSLPAFQAGSAY